MPVAFRIIEPWTKPLRMAGVQGDAGQNVLRLAGIVLGITIMVGGALLARRNLRLGRGDRKGPFKLATYVPASSLMTRLARAHHLPPPQGEFGPFLRDFWNSPLLSG